MCHHLGWDRCLRRGTWFRDGCSGSTEKERCASTPSSQLLKTNSWRHLCPFLLFHFTPNWSGNQFDLHGLKIYLECDYFFPFHCNHPGVSLSVSSLHPSAHPHHSNLGTFKFSHVSPFTKSPAVASMSLIPEVVFPSLAFWCILSRTPTPNSVLILITPGSLLPMGLFSSCIVFA